MEHQKETKITRVMTAFHEIKLYNFENYVVNIKCNGYFGKIHLFLDVQNPLSIL